MKNKVVINPSHLRSILDMAEKNKLGVVEVIRLIVAIRKVAYYRYLWHKADTPESTALAAWNRDDAVTNLLMMLNRWEFTIDQRNYVKQVAEHIQWRE